MGIFFNLEEIEHKINSKLESVEEGSVFKGDGMFISADSTNGRGGYYFKVYDAENFSKATKVARLNLQKPEYEYHRTPGKNIWILNSSEMRKMINILKSVNDGKSVWDRLAEECNKSKSNGNLPKSLPMPDYMNIKVDSKRAKKLK